jgi:ribosomal protein S4
MQKGTTPSYMRPYHKEVRLETDGFTDINVVNLLAELGFAQSKAEAKRLVEQNLIWIDDKLNDMSGMDIPIGAETSIYDRLHKIELHEKKFYLVQPDNILCVGKTLDEAVCHRICFLAPAKPKKLTLWEKFILTTQEICATIKTWIFRTSQ